MDSQELESQLITGTAVTLKEFILLHFRLHEKALELATAEMNRRLESMNEFRNQLNVQTHTFLTRAVFETYIATVSAQLDSIKQELAETRGKANMNHVYISWILAGGAIIIAFLK